VENKEEIKYLLRMGGKSLLGRKEMAA